MWYLLICDDHLDGIFTAVYEAWERKLGLDSIKILANTGNERNFELFTEEIFIKTDYEKAEKTARTLKRKFGEEGWQMLCQAAASWRQDKAQAVFETVRFGLALPHPEKIMEYLSVPEVFRAFELSRNTWNEMHHLYGFLRFQELKNGVLFAKIKPKNHVLSFLAPHFADRLPGENFMIYDEGREEFAVHRSGGSWILVTEEKLKEGVMDFSAEEEMIQKLWKRFHESIAVTERKNKELQQKNLPKYFRKNMVEFVK